MTARELFEERAKLLGYCLHRDDKDKYKHPITQSLYKWFLLGYIACENEL